MRICGGRARGIVLKTAKQAQVRPATDRMREAVFSSLGPVVEGARCLDLFAGTGAYGLEALSRGAEGVNFVEQQRPSVATIGTNLAAVCKSLGREPGCCMVEQRDVFSYRVQAKVYDLVFADPPYAMLPQRAEEILTLAEQALRPEGLLVFEMPGEVELHSQAFSLQKRLGKGRNDPSVCIFSLKFSQE